MMGWAQHISPQKMLWFDRKDMKRPCSMFLDTPCEHPFRVLKVGETCFAASITLISRDFISSMKPSRGARPDVDLCQKAPGRLVLPGRGARCKCCWGDETMTSKEIGA